MSNRRQFLATLAGGAAGWSLAAAGAASAIGHGCGRAEHHPSD
ncbi:MAG: hypothetical protein WDM77_10735 [Steroidobacteraceae bacterium]